MKFLLKFVEKEKYAQDVIKGSLYLNSLSYFWETPLDSFVSDRNDIFEGTYVALNKEALSIEEGLKNVIGPNPLVRLSAYEYVNLFCAYRAEYDTKSKKLIIPKHNLMNEFGKFVVVIMDEIKFRRRVLKSSNNLNYDCVLVMLIIMRQMTVEDRSLETCFILN